MPALTLRKWRAILIPCCKNLMPRKMPVTGVQTCALPILEDFGFPKVIMYEDMKKDLFEYLYNELVLFGTAALVMRSEERRVGKEC